MIDLLIIKPGAQKKLYQDLSKSISGIEPPLWAILIASFIRNKGFKVKVIDAEIESEKIIPCILSDNPKLIAIIVSGTNPSASTMNMVGARIILNKINKIDKHGDTILMGLHPTALPEKTMKEELIDFVCEGEGFYTIERLLCNIKYKDILGLWYKENSIIRKTERAELVNLDTLPMPAWNLLPMDKYRAHNWHCFEDIEHRSPYAVIYTSLGCPFSCEFCCLKSFFGQRGIRYRNPENVIKEIDYLIKNYNIKNIKILDEMFDLNEKHVIDICDLIIKRKYDLNIWCYARVDTINERKLKKMKKAGINWLGIGYESGSQLIRNNINKGKFNNNKIKKITDMIHNNGIYIGGNFVFGLPGDNFKTMQATLDLAIELNCEFTNFNINMPYPGSELYKKAVINNTVLPDTWLGYSQYGYETQPLATECLSSTEIIKFRDNAFLKFYGNKKYQDMILKKFGKKTLLHIRDMIKIKLKRRYK